MTSKWKQKKLDKSLFKTLSHDIKDPLLCAIASVRDYGIRDSRDLQSFFNNNISDLKNSDIVPNIEEACSVFRNPPSSAFIFGDYDVDGTFSSFMLKNILYSGGCKDAHFFIPHRKSDGYGLNENSLQHLLEQIGNKTVELVVFLDCGTNSKKEIETLKKELGNPIVIVIDHHIVEPEDYSENADVVVNNRLKNDVPPYATGGLVYQIARHMKDDLKFDADRLLPYAAIATVADVSPLVGDNRIIVSNGLKEISNVKNHGLVELMRVSGVDQDNCTVEDISFRIAPRLNANGRLEHANKVLHLLGEKNEDDAFAMALEMNAINEERRRLQKKMINSAVSQIGEDYDGHGILLYNDKWEIGIVGIVASKLTEKYGVPSLVFGNHNGQIKGSARSVKGVNIKETMDKMAHVFEGYGGHEMAAGATLKEEYAEKANDIFEKALSEYKTEMHVEDAPVEYDLVLKTKTFNSIDDSFCEKIQQFGPFGHDNEKILFRVDNVTCSAVREWGSGSGAFVSFRGLNFDCFVYRPNAADQMENKSLDILFEIGENFKDDQKWAVIVSDFKEHEKETNKSHEPTETDSTNLSKKEYYAGIGSRSTPEDIQDLMTKIARHMNGKGYILRSGGAKGADSAFEKGAGDQKEIFLPWPGFQNNNSEFDGKRWKYKKVHLRLAQQFHPRFQYLKQGAKKLMIRNSAQIIGKHTKDTPSKFVICWTKDGKDSGGTGQALRIARSMGIKVYNLHDQKIREKFEKIVSG